MKKLLSIAAISALFTIAANADLIRVEGAVGVWQSDPTGTMQYKGNPEFDLVDEAGLDASTNSYVWVYLKHPVPVIPNIRLEYVNPTFDGKVGNIEWDGNTYASVNNTLTLTQYDAVLYYNILDNTFWSTIDLGLDIKYIDGSYKLDESSATAPAVDEVFSITMPLAYARARVQLPVTDIGIEAIARGMSYSGNTVVDAEIKIDYTMDFVPVVQPGLELGYRYQQVKLDGGTVGLDANIDTTFSGIYGGIMVRF
ncbi:MAG: TIGR04219 family outer membrane beta-barrel protein [Helicobacteraceae bacterium]|nr:TIGR04219 family outer membrane beta-barrel protein [Helicobacteraceae bacterium]